MNNIYDELTLAAPARIRLDDDDLRIGLKLELEASAYAAKLEIIQSLAKDHAESLRRKYGAGSDYVLEDWLTGFEYKGDHHGE